MKLIRVLCSSGADLVELGMPFSDPIADGRAVQGAMKRSLSRGFKLEALSDIVIGVRDEGIHQPLIVMCYYNNLLRRGLAQICGRLSEAGVDGLLVVDLPLEESSELERVANDDGLALIRLIARSTPEERVRTILEVAQGFTYLVSVSGTTGVRDHMDPSALASVRKISMMSRIPVVMGFGISQPLHARKAVENGASGVVEGSGLISIYEDDNGPGSLENLARHARAMKEAMLP
jgi:tryptophan synthase alpha chain